MIGKLWVAAWLLLISLAAVAEKSYVLMENDLAALKTDFNDAVDQVRLVFIVGPT